MPSPSMSLTARQRDLLDFIRTFIRENDFAPSYEEMAAGMGLRSKSRVAVLIEALVERGAVKRLPNGARTVTLLDEPTLPADIEQRVTAYCRRIGITRPVFNQRAAECLLRGRA